jgi:hypothetical protein
VVDLCVLPPFEGWDEYQHVGYVEHVRATSARPVLGAALVPSALLREAVKLPHPASVVRGPLGKVGAVDYEGFWAGHNPRDPSSRPLTYLGGGVTLYEAQHGPLYYRLAAPVFATLGGTGDLKTSVAGLRLVNLGLTAASLALTLGLLRRLMPSERDAALAALPLAAHPLFLLNGTRVANDALGVFLASLAVATGLALALEIGRLGRRPAWCGLALGLVAGLAALAKATNLALAPFALACWLVRLSRERGRGARVWLAGAMLATGGLALVTGEVRFNLARYGLPTAMQEAVIHRIGGRTPADLLRAAATIPWGTALPRLWGRELFFKGGWSFLRTHPVITYSYEYAITVGLAGWAVWAARRPGAFRSFAAPALGLVLVLGYTAALAYHMAESKLVWGVSTTNSWYACPALPWFLAMAVGGGLAWSWDRGPGRRLGLAVPAALASAGLAGEFVGIWGQMVPAYTAEASGSEALRRLALLQPPALGTPTLLAALAAEVLILAALALTLRDGDAPETRPSP